MAAANFLQLFMIIGLAFVSNLRGIAEAREVGIAGRTFTTTVRELEEPYRVTLRNPCRATKVARSGYRREAMNPEDFNSRMLGEVNTAIELLDRIERADPNVGECRGLGPLKTIPLIPSFAMLPLDETLEQIYKIGLYFASHLKVMILDRQMVTNNTVGMPMKYLRCGTESTSLIGLFKSLTRTMEDMLCLLVVEVTDETILQSFGHSYDQLMNVEMLRFQSSCSSMEVRDCLVIDELHRFLHFNMLPALKGFSTRITPLEYVDVPEYVLRKRSAHD